MDKQNNVILGIKKQIWPSCCYTSFHRLGSNSVALGGGQAPGTDPGARVYHYATGPNIQNILVRCELTMPYTLTVFTINIVFLVLRPLSVQQRLYVHLASSTYILFWF